MNARDAIKLHRGDRVRIKSTQQVLMLQVCPYVQHIYDLQTKYVVLQTKKGRRYNHLQVEKV